MINQYTQQVKREVDSCISKIPKGDGSIKGLSKKMQAFEKLLRSLDEKLKKMGNEFLEKNDTTNEDIERVKSVNVEQIKRFIESINK